MTAHLQCYDGAMTAHLQCYDGAMTAHLQCYDSAMTAHLQCYDGAITAHLQCYDGAMTAHLQCYDRCLPVPAQSNFHTSFTDVYTMKLNLHLPLIWLTGQTDNTLLDESSDTLIPSLTLNTKYAL